MQHFYGKRFSPGYPKESMIGRFLQEFVKESNIRKNCGRSPTLQPFPDKVH